jgi:hypothetical protein
MNLATQTSPMQNVSGDLEQHSTSLHAFVGLDVVSYCVVLLSLIQSAASKSTTKKKERHFRSISMS